MGDIAAAFGGVEYPFRGLTVIGGLIPIDFGGVGSLRGLKAEGFVPLCTILFSGSRTGLQVSFFRSGTTKLLFLVIVKAPGLRENLRRRSGTDSRRGLQALWELYPDPGSWTLI